MADDDAAEELHGELYGPQRTLARVRAKRLLEEDHVKQNLQRGIERQSSRETFKTETALSFRVCHVVFEFAVS